MPWQITVACTHIVLRSGFHIFIVNIHPCVTFVVRHQRNLIHFSMKHCPVAIEFDVVACLTFVGIAIHPRLQVSQRNIVVHRIASLNPVFHILTIFPVLPVAEAYIPILSTILAAPHLSRHKRISGTIRVIVGYIHIISICRIHFDCIESLKNLCREYLELLLRFFGRNVEIIGKDIVITFLQTIIGS